jgi:ABC-type nitrate/sulfonate/bicarbonate transport system ATPase subunit
MISIKNLSKKYGDNVVLNNFDLDINKGEVTCILGESGSGKTTLLNAIASLTKYDGYIDKVKCSYVFQKPNLFDNLTVEKNLRLVNNDDTVIAEILQKLKISDKINAYPRHLSGGQAQRVSLARGLIFESDVLLLDEPFASLDLKTKIAILNDVKMLFKERNMTVICVTHDIDEAVYIADRIIVLKNGKIEGNVCLEKTTNDVQYGQNEKIRKILFDILTK